MDDCHIIKMKLSEALHPTRLEVTNFSDMHAGHVGSPNSGRSHFRVAIAANSLKPLSRVQAHQKIYEVLAQEMSDHIHALEITLL